MTETQKQREFGYGWDDFNLLRGLSNAHTGILVPDEKFDMFYSRLSRRLRKLGLTDFRQYCRYLQDHPELEFTEFINAITTNLTSFFREPHHFDFLQQRLIPELVQTKPAEKVVKAWSAGCSSGEEAYSIAMTFAEQLPLDWGIRILATDVDTDVLHSAANGVYSGDSVTAIPKMRLQRWFLNGTGLNAGKVKVKPELQQLITFKQLNLMKAWPIRGVFDVIFCRNVLIYFDRETKGTLVKRFGELISTGGYLFIGHSESLHHFNTGFKLIGNTIYQKLN